jgi:hypothetical protein
VVNGAPRFYLFDGLGNTRELVSSTGQFLGQTRYPAGGPYDSTDPKVIERYLTLTAEMAATFKRWPAGGSG